MGRRARCVICYSLVDKYEFPLRGNICFNCELSCNVYTVRKGLVSWMVKSRDVYRAALGSAHFPLTFNFVYLRDGRYIQCAFCGKFVYYRTITRDHVYPKSKGGTMKAPACIDCNVAKENRLPIEWALYAYKHNLDIATIPLGAEYLFGEIVPTRVELYQQIVDLFAQIVGVV